MSAATFSKYINNKKTLFWAAIVYILPFILFSFWSFPAADDYMIIVKRSGFTFWQLQQNIYQNWTGRYFATFISSAFSYNGFLYSHYYLHSILLLSFTIFSWLFCLIQINKYLLSARLSFFGLVLISMLLLIAEINIIPEPVTAFYWFSSAVTYQTPLIIMIFLAGIIIKSSFVPFNIRTFLVAALLVISLNGCNEIITILVLLFSSFLVAYQSFKYKNLPKFIAGLFVTNVISAGFLLFSPGIAHRETLLTDGSFFSACSIAVVKFLIISWFFLKEPLWWFSLLFTIVFISNNKHLFKGFFQYFNNFSIWFLLLFYLATGLLIYVPVLYFTNGSLPVRAENILCFLYSLLLLILISTWTSRKISSPFAFPFHRFGYLLFSILIFSTANMKKITDSLLSGFFYSQIMKERLSLLETAKQRNRHEITYDDYETLVNKKLISYPIINRQILRDIIVKPPPIISFGNDLYYIKFMKEFYGIQRLNIQSK